MDANAHKFQPPALLLEDEPLARWVARKAIEEAGCSVTEAASCEEARRHIETQDFCALILDYRLPDGTGLDVARYARDRGQKAPILMLTAETGEITPELRDEIGIAEALSKPVEVATLHDRLAVLLRDAAVKTEDVCASAAPPEWIGRFRIVRASGCPDAQTLADLAPGQEDMGWLALDWQEATLPEAGALEKLLDLAQRCRAVGGRLAVLVGQDELARLLRGVRGGKDFDLVSDPRMLEALSRRSSSYCERSSLLDSIVRPPDGQEVAP